MLRLHIARDEKVIDRCIDNFEKVFPYENKYVIILGKGEIPKRVTRDVIFTEYNTKQFWKIIGDVNQYDSIIIHFLSPDCVDFVNKIKHNNIYWIEWGADLYNLLQNRGYRLFYNPLIPWQMSHVRVPKFIYFLGKKLYCWWLEKRTIRAVKKIRYFVPDSMYDEFEMIKRYYPEFSHLQYKDFFYYPIDEVLGPDLFNRQVSGNNIIVGNSASTYGNHVLIFEKLKAINNLHNKIIVPLSYGNKKYANYVEKKGEKLFGERFEPITDFLPLQKYNELFLTANVYIYGNWRQEAVGNILIALFLGGKVFLENSNPLLNYYRREKLIIFSTSDLTEEIINTPLKKEEIQNNRDILMRLYSRERLLNLIANNF